MTRAPARYLTHLQLSPSAVLANAAELVRVIFRVEVTELPVLACVNVVAAVWPVGRVPQLWLPATVVGAWPGTTVPLPAADPAGTAVRDRSSRHGLGPVNHCMHRWPIC